jgi:hypothetical protein
MLRDIDTIDGTYVADWEWTDADDLDECNGMTVNGQYGYYVTDAYPWVMAWPQRHAGSIVSHGKRCLFTFLFETRSP